MVTTVVDTLQAFLLPYAAHFRAQGWVVDAAAADRRGTAPIDAFDGFHEIPWSRAMRDPRNLTTAARAIRTILKRNRYDIVHTHTPIASFITRVAVGTLPAARRPRVVYTAHGFHFHPGGGHLVNGAFIAAEKAAGHWTDRVVVINDDDLRAARRLHLAGGRVTRFPGIGVDLDRYRPTPPLRERATRLRRELGLGPGDVLFTMVAEMIPRKNHLTALRALAAGDRPHHHLLLVGDGPLRDRIAEEAARLGVAERTHLGGETDDVRPAMLAAAATLLPSRREGLPRAVLESLALGIPVIGSDIRGTAELVADDGGVLVDPSSAGELAGALDLMARTDVGPALGPAVAQRLHRYSQAELLRLHERLYRGLLAEAGGAAPC